MGRIIAVANQKGGVGKTTTSVNLAASLANYRSKVLLVDLDPQGNATMGSGVDKHELDLSACESIMGECHVNEAKVFSEQAGYDVLPSNSDLTAAEVGLMNATMKEKRLKLALGQVADNYDYIIIDCPPSLNMLTLNALVAADGVLIPIQTEYYALEGLSALLRTIEQIQQHMNPELKVDGILRTMHDLRNNLANQVSKQLTEHFGELVFTTIIPRNVRVAEAPSYGLPIMNYDKSSRGSVAYMAMASELMRRMKKQAQTTPGETNGN